MPYSNIHTDHLAPRYVQRPLKDRLRDPNPSKQRDLKYILHAKFTSLKHLQEKQNKHDTEKWIVRGGLHERVESTIGLLIIGL